MARPREFEIETALDAALDQFFRKGYEATSVQDLVDATGLSRASLYGAFGDKRELFLKSLARYGQVRDARIGEIERSGRPPAEAIREILLSAADECLPEQALGCLVVNTGVELSGCDGEIRGKVLESLVGVRATFSGLLRGSGAEDAEGKAGHLLTAFVGLKVLARAGVGCGELRGMIDSVMSSLNLS